MSSRNLKNMVEATRCGGCCDAATHSTTDAKQTETGWEETAPRHGCALHPVRPNVILIDGTIVPFSEYHAN